MRQQGRDDEALELTQLAERRAAPDDIDAQVLWRAIRAPILARTGVMEEAEALAHAAHEKARQTEMPSLRGSALMALATVMRLAGRAEEARAALEEAIGIHAAKRDIVSEGRAREMLASP